MPTTYTHFAYGRDVLAILPGPVQEEIRPYIHFYDIGVHGPDILFYYRSFRRNSVNQYGVKVHHEPGAVFFRHAMKEYLLQGCRPEAKAYLAGFMTHYILDSTCHPYIRLQIRRTGISHTEIETDFDAVLMEEDGKNPRKYHTAKHLRTSGKYTKIIAPYYLKSPGQIREGLIEMKLVLNRLFHTRFGFKRFAASMISRFFVPGLKLPAYYVKKEINPGNKATMKRLGELYDSSQPECADMICLLLKALDEQDETFLDNDRLRRTFS